MSDTLNRAAAYFNIGIGQAEAEKRREAARKAIMRAPFFKLVATDADKVAAVDFLIFAVDDMFAHFLDVMMRSRPSFDSDAAHMLFVGEAVKSTCGQLDHLLDSLLPSVANALGKFAEEADKETQRKMKEAMYERVASQASQIEKLVDVLSATEH